MLPPLRYRHDSCASSGAFGSSCLSAASSFSSDQYSTAPPVAPRNLSSSVAASPYEYDIASGQSTESVNQVRM